MGRTLRGFFEQLPGGGIFRRLGSGRQACVARQIYAQPGGKARGARPVQVPRIVEMRQRVQAGGSKVAAPVQAEGRWGQGRHIGGDLGVDLRSEAAVSGVEDHQGQDALLLAQGQDLSQPGQVFLIEILLLRRTPKGPVLQPGGKSVHGGVAFEQVGPVRSERVQNVAGGDLLPAVMVKVQLKEQPGAQLRLRSPEDGRQLVPGKGHIADVDLGVALIAGEVQGGGLQDHRLWGLGPQGLLQVVVGLGQGLFRTCQHVAGQTGRVVDQGGVYVAVGVGAAQVQIVQTVCRLGAIGAPHRAVVDACRTQSQPGQSKQQRRQHREGGGKDPFFSVLHSAT